MDLGLIGLGTMGTGIARRLAPEHRVVVFDIDPAARERMTELRTEPAEDLAHLVASLSPPRAVWLVLPAGPPTDETIQELAKHLDEGDAIVDGGNSHYLDSMRRGSHLSKQGIHFLDMGTSGGVGGGERGYCLMVGGDEGVIGRLGPAFRSLASDPNTGWGRVGPTGAGHFTKMVHNGIEYGLIRAYAQGLTALSAKTDFELDLQSVTGIWRSGAMARSAILDLTHEALMANPALGALAPYVADLGPERWTRAEAIDQVAQRGFDREQFA